MRAALLIAVLLAACAPRQRSAEPLAQRTSTPRAAEQPDACANLQYDASDPSVADAPTLCRHVHDELVPHIADAAVRCLQAAQWSVCDVSRCVTDALAAAPPEQHPHCTHVEQRCPGMGQHCVTHIGGMNPSGQQRFASCLVTNCGKGLRACLWDSMSTPCGP